MVANVQFQPYNQTNAPGTYTTQAVGLVQGQAYPDPAIRFKLAGGVLSANETIVMWGGVGIYTNVPGANGGAVQLGPVVGRATALTGTTALTGFSVTDQAYGMIITPSSPVPTIGSGGQVNYYRLGSGARIAVAADPSLITLQGLLTTTAVSWDFVNQKLIPSVSTTASSGTYNSTTGLVTLTLAATQTLSPGDTVTVSGATGTGSFANINGTFQAGVGTGSTTLTYTIATGLTLTITGATVATSGILPVQVLDIQPSNNMTVLPPDSNGNIKWNFNGAAALILI